MLKFPFILILLSAMLSSMALFADDEDLDQEIQKDRAEAAQTQIDAIHDAKAKATSQVVGNLNPLNMLGGKKKGSATVPGVDAVEKLKELLAANFRKDQKKEDIRAQLLANTEGARAGELFQKYPKLLNITVDLMHDQEALPGLFNLLGKKRALRKYFVIAVGILIFSFFFRSQYLKPRMQKAGYLKRTLASVGVTIFFMSVTMLIFYNMFKPEIRPTVTIVGRNIFG